MATPQNTTRTGTATVTSISLFPWDFKIGDIFSYGKETYYVNADSTKVFACTIRKSDKRFVKVRISSLIGLAKEDIRRATEAEKAEFIAVVEAKEEAEKADDRICQGATVRIKDPKQAVKYDYAPETIFVVVSVNKRLTLIPLGGLKGNQRGLIFPASLLEYAPVVAVSE